MTVYMKSQFTDTKNRTEATQGWGEGLIVGVTAYWLVLLWNDEKVLEMDSGNGCTKCEST